MTRAVLLLCAFSLAGCTWWNPGNAANPGNPGNTPYAGEPGSVFDASAGPPRPVRPEPVFDMPPAAPLPGSVSSGTLPPVSPAPR